MDDFRRPPVNRLNQNGQPGPTPSPDVQGPQALPVAPDPVPTPTPEVVPPIQPPAQSTQPTIEPQPIETPPTPEQPPTKKPRKKKRALLVATIIILLAAILTVGVAWFWYQSQLAPVNNETDTKVLVEIELGSTPDAIAATLKENNVIRNETAFLWYTRLNGTQNSLQAGSYRLSPSESTPEIVTHLTKGSVDTFDITFLPGSTLEQNRKVFLDAGYSQEEVDAAFSATYESPLFQDKPESADLEGYIYGDTYRFGAGASVQEILEHVFENFAGIVEENGFVASFEANGLNLYEGITLASIIQRESIGGDEPQIAQVFYSRIAIGMPLGSDVTYQYIADKLGVERDVNLDSPYNTRRYAGLPPGPIATPGINSLKAVATPAEGDYLYFLSGDDDVTYFGRTNEEHEANIVNHCKVKCQII